MEFLWRFYDVSSHSWTGELHIHPLLLGGTVSNSMKWA